MNRFISLEGGEGVGKSTQLSLLVSWLRKRAVRVTETFEPGATPAGARIKDTLLRQDIGELAPLTELLLFAADRNEHVRQVVRPSLDKGDVVVSSRFTDSTIAYQSAAGGVPLSTVRAVCDLATNETQPGLVIVLDVKPEVALARIAVDVAGGRDRIEANALDFHREVRNSFLSMASNEPDRYAVVDADRPVNVVADEVAAVVARYLRLEH